MLAMPIDPRATIDGWKECMMVRRFPLSPSVACVLLACGGTLSSTPDAGSDTSTPDATETTDASIPDTQSDDADYHDLADPKFWSLIDVTSLLSPIKGFQFRHSCFDGRYVYWSAQNDAAVLLRYDTSKSFNDLSSWSTWTLDQYEYAETMFFDGHYVYIAGGASALRFDTQGTFGDRGSMQVAASIFGYNGLLPDISGIGNASSDGRYIYFQGLLTAPPHDSITIRFDTQGNFKTRASWSAFDPQISDMGIYFAPAIVAAPYLIRTPTFPPGSTALFYDTRLPFTDPTSWTKFPLKGVTGDAAYLGVGTDARYAYFVPYRSSQGGSGGLVARYDTTAPPTHTGSWQTFDLTKVNPYAKGFHNSSWDGRYYYFMVGSDSMQFPSKGAIVARYNTTLDFQKPASWSAVDLTPLIPSSQQAPLAWSGAVVFDGEYIYLASGDGAVIMRFDARSPRKLPQGFSGSFY
jgi:hypothetical protein